MGNSRLEFTNTLFKQWRYFIFVTGMVWKVNLVMCSQLWVILGCALLNTHPGSTHFGFHFLCLGFFFTFLASSGWKPPCFLISDAYLLWLGQPKVFSVSCDLDFSCLKGCAVSKLLEFRWFWKSLQNIIQHQIPISMEN